MNQRGNVVVIRRYEPERDLEAVHRIWRECGWTEEGKEHEQDSYMEHMRAWVGELNGEAECLVLNDTGSMRYLETEVPISCVTGVTTGYTARRHGLAGRALARTLAEEVERGAVVSALGAFEQGFYNRLGYGTGAYDHYLRFDPADLRVPGRSDRFACRLTMNDWEEAHGARLRRHRPHGAINLFNASVTRVDMLESRKGFGMGFRDPANDALTHYVWLQARNREHGPYKVAWMVYRSAEELLDLLRLLEGIGDQVRLIEMAEPSGVQLQVLLTQPFRKRAISERSKFASQMHAVSWFQYRLLDLRKALAQTHLSGGTIRFNLILSDPIERYVDDSSGWRGIGGAYVVTLGPESSAAEGADTALPELHAAVGAFTRLWLGVRPATGLTVTDDLSGSEDLLAALDRILQVPQPHADWDF